MVCVTYICFHMASDPATTAEDYPPMMIKASIAWVVYRFFLRMWVARSERRAKNLIRAYDQEVQLSLAELMEGERKEAGGGAIGGERRRFRPRRARDMACALAHEAYMEFGHRPRSEANLIITRKYMRDLLLEFKDLRARDALGIIDTALYLSFLPSTQLRDMNELDNTTSFVKRTADVPGSGAWWWPSGLRGHRHRA